MLARGGWIRKRLMNVLLVANLSCPRFSHLLLSTVEVVSFLSSMFWICCACTQRTSCHWRRDDQHSCRTGSVQIRVNNSSMSFLQHTSTHTHTHMIVRAFNYEWRVHVQCQCQRSICTAHHRTANNVRYSKDLQAFSRTLQCVALRSSAAVIWCSLSVVVCRLWRECIVAKRLKLESHGFHRKVWLKFETFSTVVLTTKFEDIPSIGGWGLKLGQGGFRLRRAISQTYCEIELRSQEMGFRSVQTSMTLNDLERSKRM